MDPVTTLPPLPVRRADGHKGTFGTTLVVAGSAREQRMIGAAIFVACAATRAGTGLVRVLVPEPICNAVLAGSPQATAIALAVDPDGQLCEQKAIQQFDESLSMAQSVVIGPGMGGGQAVARLSVRAIQQEEAPVVVDADALNALAMIPEFTREVRGRVIVTPHPGEFRRLAASLGIRHDPVDPVHRESAASALAQRLGCIVVLKGINTVVSDGHRVWICSHGHPCLATGGTGDILAGLIGGLLAQYAPPSIMVPGQPAPALGLFELACIAVQAHARAGEEWARLNRASAGLLPQELAALIPSVLESMRASADPTDRP